MKIISIHIFSLYKEKPIILSSAFALSFVSILQRRTLKEFANFHSRLVIERLQKGAMTEVKLEQGICYAISQVEKIGCTIICDEEYPKRIAIELLIKIVDNFKDFLAKEKIDLNSIEKDTDVKFDYLKNTIIEWQDPSKKDNIMILQDHLIELNNIMKQNLNELLKRGENLENLMEKSEDLKASSVNFYIYAKKTNRCCKL